MTILTIVHPESFAVILHRQKNNNGEIEMTILAIVHHVSHLHCYYALTEEQLKTLRLKSLFQQLFIISHLQLFYINGRTTTVRLK